MRYLALLLLVSCVQYVHMEPRPRSYDEQTRSTVELHVRCDGLLHIGTGVAISERHVLTAAHVTRCHTIPTVHLTLYNGDRHRAVVTRENRTQDIAKVEIIHAGSFDLGIAPPLLGVPWDPLANDYVCAHPFAREPHCSWRLSPNLVSMRLFPGDSGTPIYDYGLLLGLVIRDNAPKNATTITLVTEDWMEGT